MEYLVCSDNVLILHFYGIFRRFSESTFYYVRRATFRQSYVKLMHMNEAIT